MGEVVILPVVSTHPLEPREERLQKRRAAAKLEPRDAGCDGAGTVSITVRVPQASMQALAHQARAMHMPVEEALGKLIAEWFPAGDSA